MMSSNKSSGGRSGGQVVLRSGNDVQIKLGSSTQATCHQHCHLPHQIQRVAGGATNDDVGTDIEGLRRIPSTAVQPSAPGQDTLLRRPTTSSTIHRSSTTVERQVQEAAEDQPMELRPPPFNPNCPGNCVSNTAGISDQTGDTAASEATADDLHVPKSSFSASAPGGALIASPPPSYDEIYGDKNARHPPPLHPHHQQQNEDVEQNELTQHYTLPETVNGLSFSSSQPCTAVFGTYSDPNTPPQPGCFTRPTRISGLVDPTLHQPRTPSVMVIDQIQSAVHIFTSTGDSLSVLRVPRVNGGCFLERGSLEPLILLAVGESVCMYDRDGQLVKKIPLRGRDQNDSILTTVQYGNAGFVAVRSRSLSICRGGVDQPASIRTIAGRYRLDRGPVQATTASFVNVLDVAVDRRHGHLVVLDAADPRVSGHRTAVYIMRDDGSIVRAIRPAREPRCGPMERPFSVTVDRSGNVLVSDGGRVVQFSGDGRYLATLIGDDTTSKARKDYEVRDIAAVSSTDGESLLAVFTGYKFAQVQLFRLQSQPTQNLIQTFS